MTNLTFEQYLKGKPKIDKSCNFLIENIKNDVPEQFFKNWKLFQEKFGKIDNLNISRVFSSLIEEGKTDWFENLPFNKSCHAVMYASKKYYLQTNAEHVLKNRELLHICFNNMKKISKSSVIKDFETLKNYIKVSVYEKEEEKCRHYLSVLLEIDDLYRSLKPQNPDKFLTYVIITQGKEIEISNYVGTHKQTLDNSVFFNEVTMPLVSRLIEFDGIGANKLNNKKESNSVHDIYVFFKKYYMYHKIDNLLPKNQKTQKKIKI